MGDYNVVFEYTEKAAGFYGSRTWTSYENKQDFEKFWQEKGKTNTEIVVAQGVPAEEATNLTSLTPEICRILAAIHKSTKKDGTIDQTTFDRNLTSYLMIISYDREKIEDNSKLTRRTIGKFLEHWARTAASDTTLKGELIRITLDHTNIYGQVKIGELEKDFLLTRILK